MQAAQVKDHIVNWLQTYSRKAKTQGFVVGVSGGIDSAVTSTLCAHTGQPVTLVEMPIHQPESQVSRAAEHIDELVANFPNCQRAHVDLSHVFDNFISALPAVDASDKRQMSLVNTRARLRMSTLYYFAALEGKLVAGTGNKVEDFGVGFYTKYGDGGVDISPIADLLKTEVYAMGKELNISYAIMKAPPTDGLWGDDRTDEDQIGASYPELEWAMAQQDLGKTTTDFSGRQQEVMKIFTRLNRANKHKMLPIPVCEIPANLKQ
jgi:NAD+ synthase